MRMGRQYLVPWCLFASAPTTVSVRADAFFVSAQVLFVLVIETIALFVLGTFALSMVRRVVSMPFESQHRRCSGSHKYAVRRTLHLSTVPTSKVC